LVSKEDHLLRQVTRAMGPGRATISENFSDFRLNEPIPSSEFTFDTAGMLGAKAPNEVETRHQELGFNPQLGDVLPDFHSMDLSGKQISLGQFRGKVVLLYGWTFGIGNYQWDLPHFQKLYEQYGKQGLVVIGIPFDGLGDRPQILKYLRSKGITNPQVFDGMGRKAGIQKQYHKLGTIFDYVIDREGHLYAKDPWEKDIDKAVYEALGK
jgi:peroxiredoxin